MKVYEAQALSRRVVEDLLAAQEAVNLAMAAVRRDLIVPHNPDGQNTIATGPMLDVENEVAEAMRKVGTLKRSLAVLAQELYQARTEVKS